MFNVALTLALLWVIKDQSSLSLLSTGVSKPRRPLASVADQRTTTEVIEEFKRMSFAELLAKLHDHHLVENGFMQSDLALGLLVSFHHLDLMRALYGRAALIQKQEIPIRSENQLQKMVVYPGLSVEEYQTIYAFAQKERWPFTAEGLYTLWHKAENHKEKTLEEAFYLTHEFQTVEKLIRQSGASIDKTEIFQMLMEVDWRAIQQFNEQQRIVQETPSVERQRLLLDFIAKKSKNAAHILLKTEGAQVSKRLDDATVIAILNLLTVNSKEAKAFVAYLLGSPRSDAVRQLASLTLQKLSEQPDADGRVVRDNVLTHFTPNKNGKNATPNPPVVYQKQTVPKQTTVSETKKVKTYIVQEGDSLWKISRRHKTTIEGLKKHNNLKSDLLKPGTTLKIP